MSGEYKKPGNCDHPNEWIDQRRYDGNHTVCHLCRSHIMVNITHYANGTKPEEQYYAVLDSLKKQSNPAVLAPEPIGYVVFFGHSEDDNSGPERAGFEFYESEAEKRASFIGNGATYKPVYTK